MCFIDHKSKTRDIVDITGLRAHVKKSYFPLLTKYYDNNGNMIKETIADDSKVHEYDKLNRNIKTEYKGKISNFKYNFEGKRVEKEVDGNKRRYLYEGSKVILETDENGNKLSKNVYGIRLIQRTIEDDIVNYLYNGHGDVTSLINQSEDITDTYYFDEFGNHEEKTGNTHNPYRYAGYVYDEETDLYYLNARYYDSDIARFTSEDTYRGDIKDPLSLNLYTYVSNNPLIYTDPTGHVKVDLEEDYVMNLKKKALKYGSKGAGVREVQARLKNLGYDIDVDGSFGKQTKKVVEQFQKDYNLKVDGKVGTQTYGKLIKLRGKLEVNASTNTGGSKKDSDAVGDGPKVDVDIELETTLRNEQNLRREIKEKEELFVRRGAYKAERELEENNKTLEEKEKPFWSDHSKKIKILGIGTDNDPNNNDEFLTMNVGRIVADKYDIGGNIIVAGQQSSLRIFNGKFFGDWIQTSLTFDNSYMNGEGGLGVEVNNAGLEGAIGGYGTCYEGGLIPQIKIGKLGLKVRAYALAKGAGVYVKGGINYTDSSNRYHIFNIEGVIEKFFGIKLNIDLFWE
ncbi:peptidoglycan-binding protein [Clostridiaceae bacterium M8S5]|nr:peptidoglycan-binding protein [Clostridiaceae bacterium M8S5]